MAFDCLLKLKTLKFKLLGSTSFAPLYSKQSLPLTKSTDRAAVRFSAPGALPNWPANFRLENAMLSPLLAGLLAACGGGGGGGTTPPAPSGDGDNGGDGNGNGGDGDNGGNGNGNGGDGNGGDGNDNGNKKPTGFSLSATSVELHDLQGARKLADITITDDGLGENTLALTEGEETFEIRNTNNNGGELWLKAFALDFETAESHTATISLTATGTGDTLAPVSFTLTVTDFDDNFPTAVSSDADRLTGEIDESNNLVSYSLSTEGVKVSLASRVIDAEGYRWQINKLAGATEALTGNAESFVLATFSAANSQWEAAFYSETEKDALTVTYINLGQVNVAGNALQSGHSDLINLSGDNLVVTEVEEGLGGGYAEGDRMKYILHVRGSEHDDELTGDDLDNIIFAGDGNDVTNGGAGDDVFFGGGGDDILNGGAGDDALRGGAGDDIIDGGAGDDVMGGGSDSVFGEAGDDIFVLNLNDGERARDVVTDFGEGNDKIRVDTATGAETTIEALQAAAQISWEFRGLFTAISFGGDEDVMWLQGFTDDLTIAHFDIV